MDGTANTFNRTRSAVRAATVATSVGDAGPAKGAVPSNVLFILDSSVARSTPPERGEALSDWLLATVPAHEARDFLRLTVDAHADENKSHSMKWAFQCDGYRMAEAGFPCRTSESSRCAQEKGKGKQKLRERSRESPPTPGEGEAVVWIQEQVRFQRISLTGSTTDSRSALKTQLWLAHVWRRANVAGDVVVYTVPGLRQEFQTQGGAAGGWAKDFVLVYGGPFTSVTSTE